VSPILCGFYRLTPSEVADQTPAELAMMLDGLDWVNDRDWEKAVFLIANPTAAQELLDLSYPHFRVDPSKRVVKSVSSGPRLKPEGGTRRRIRTGGR
jgi:hypothetical protein